MRSHGVGSVTREGNLSTEHLEEDDAKGIDIDAGIDGVAQYHFRCHIFGSAKQHARAGEGSAEGVIAILDDASNAEVSQD